MEERIVRSARSGAKCVDVKRGIGCVRASVDEVKRARCPVRRYNLRFLTAPERQKSEKDTVKAYREGAGDDEPRYRHSLSLSPDTHKDAGTKFERMNREREKKSR